MIACDKIAFFQACTNSCVQYLWELPAKDTARCSRRVYTCVNCTPVSAGPNYCSGIGGVICSMAAEAAGGYSNQPSCANSSALTFPAFLIVKNSTHTLSLSLPTNVNFSQLGRTRLLYYWLREFARLAVCVSCQNQMFMGTRGRNYNSLTVGRSQLVSLLLHCTLSWLKKIIIKKKKQKNRKKSYLLNRLCQIWLK